MVDTLHPPLSVIESWPKPNYVDPVTRGPGLIYTAGFLNGLGIFVVAARLYSRYFMTKALGLDDVLVFLSLSIGIGLSVLVIIGNVVFFDGHHVWDIPPGKAVGHRKNVYACEWCYAAALSFVKISVLLFYRRLSVTFSRTFLFAVWVGIIYNILYVVGFGLALLLICSPIKAYWLEFSTTWPKTHQFSCGNEQIALPASGGLSVLGDFYSALLPMLLIVNLDLPRRQKLSLYCLFALAFVVVGAGIARTVLLNDVVNVDYDFTWALWEMWIWGLVELYAAILAASAPALKPFLRRFLVEPVASAVDNNKWKKEGSKYIDSYASQPRSNLKVWSIRSASNRGSVGLVPDPERIGVAYGGSERTDTTKSMEESFVREIDNNDLETRHFELRQSRDGKIVPMQIWKKTVSESKPTDNPIPPVARNVSMHDQTFIPQRRLSQTDHVRNFSQPHSLTASVDTTTPILHKHNRAPSQTSLVATRAVTPNTLQPPFQQRHSNHQAKPSQRSYRWSKSYSDQFPSPPRQSSPTEENQGRGSRLDSDSDDDSESLYLEKPPYNDILSATTGTSEHAVSSRDRSDSDETLHLPRMGSREMQTERDKWRIPGDGGRLYDR